MTKVEKIAKKPVTYKVKRKVSGQKLFQFPILEPVAAKIVSGFTAGLIKKKQAVFLQIMLVETGEIVKIIVPSVLHRLLEENYPNESFNGLVFEFIKGEKVKGAENEYSTFELNEIEI